MGKIRPARCERPAKPTWSAEPPRRLRRVVRLHPPRLCVPPAHRSYRRNPRGRVVGIPLTKFANHNIRILPGREPRLCELPKVRPRVGARPITCRRLGVHPADMRFESVQLFRRSPARRHPRRMEPLNEHTATFSSKETQIAVIRAKPHHDPVRHVKRPRRSSTTVTADHAVRRGRRPGTAHAVSDNGLLAASWGLGPAPQQPHAVLNLGSPTMGETFAGKVLHHARSFVPIHAQLCVERHANGTAGTPNGRNARSRVSGTEGRSSGRTRRHRPNAAVPFTVAVGNVNGDSGWCG